MLTIRRFIRLGSAGALLAGLAVGVGALSHLSGEAEGAPTTANPNRPITESLNSVSCTSTTSCLAVGFQSNTMAPPGPETTLTEMLNGASWSVVSSPNPGNNVNDLTGVSCTTSTNCVAVGYYSNTSGDTYQTLIETWNGTSWSVTPSPDQGSGDNELFGVFCTSSTNCVAVGDSINGSGYSQTLIETWNGTGWSIIPSPDPGIPSSGLEGVYCLTSTNCVAVGYYFNGPSTQGLVETWNGTIWSVSPSPGPADAGNLVSVSCTSATNCVAVGSYVGGPGSQILIESWNGSVWSVTTSPNQGRQDALSSVSCISSTNCIAVGNYLPPTGYANQTLIESWNGISWVITPSPSPGAVAYFYGVYCISSTYCIAVGQTFDTSNASQGLVESWNGSTWSTPPPTTSVLVPSSGSTVDGSIWLDAGASSQFGIASVSYEVSGGSISDQVVSSSVATSFGWLGAWDTTDVPNGTYMLQSVVTDNDGNTATSSGVTVTVENPSLATEVLVPSNGATLSGSAAVLDASAAGTSDVTEVQFVVSGGSLSDQVVGTAVATIYGWIAFWNTTAIANGPYTLESVATETGGTTAMSPPIDVTVDNGGT